MATAGGLPVRAGQGLALVTSAGVAGWFGRANKANTAVLYPPDAYRFSAAPPRSILTRLPRRAGRSQAGVAQGRGGADGTRAARQADVPPHRAAAGDGGALHLGRA